MQFNAMSRMFVIIYHNCKKEEDSVFKVKAAYKFAASKRSFSFSSDAKFSHLLYSTNRGTSCDKLGN